MSESGHSLYDPYSQQTAQEVYRSQPPRDADATQPIRVLPPLPPPPRNRLGAITFVVVVLAALLAVFPATAALGFLLCLLAIVPAIFAFRRIRKGTATNRRRALATLVLAPVFFIVATCVVAATAPPRPTITNVEATTPIQGLAAAPALQQSPTSTLVPALGPDVSQAPAAPPATVSSPAPSTPASPPLVHTAAPTAGPKLQPKPRPQPAPKPEAQPKPEAKPKPSSGSGSGPVVTSGAFCSPAGAVGVTSKGTPMSCKLDSKGERLRWSKA